MSNLLSFAPGPPRGALSRRRSMQWRGMGSITWGNRAGLGFVTPDGTIADFNTAPLFDDSGTPPMVALQVPGFSPGLVVGNPDTRPNAWPGLVPTIQANGGPAQVPKVVVTPTSGAIPSPAEVAAATAAPASWLEQSLFGGIANKYLLLAGLGAFLLFGGKKK